LTIIDLGIDVDGGVVGGGRRWIWSNASQEICGVGGPRRRFVEDDEGRKPSSLKIGIRKWTSYVRILSES
jgi:hypothetical protein